MAYLPFKNTEVTTDSIDTKDIGQAIEDMKMTAKSRRRMFERRWYNNAFFDDGFHFKFYSRSQNRVVDLSERSTIYSPQRAIPKASRQIRGISNLLMSNDPTPTVYPELVDRDKYPKDKQSPIPQPVPGTVPGAVQNQPTPPQQPGMSPQQQSYQTNPAYEAAVDQAKKVAQLRGKWLLHEWTKDDGTGETVLDKVGLMTLLTMKYGISYLQIWPDEHNEKIRTQVYDAFDIYVLGNYTNIYELPFIIKSIPMLASQIQANPLFDETQLQYLTPDNKKASSEIKDAYMQSRFGPDTTNDNSATMILNEAFVKEFLSDENRERIAAQEDGERILAGKNDGDPIIRQIFSAAGVWLYDHYTSLTEYPFVDYRMEPGPLYQVPLIERFIPTNKSLDVVLSRVERYTDTMVTGSWLKRQGEQFKINNISGGQVIEYAVTPPTQAEIAPLPPFVFQFIELLESFIEEQGVSTTTLGKIPDGVRSNAAIESLKEAEYANLVIPAHRLNAMLKKLARKCLEIADEHYVTPHHISMKHKGEMLNFSVIGDRAYRERRRLKIETPWDVVTISKNTNVDIEIEEGMAYTKEGQKETMQQVMSTMVQLLQAQAIPPQAVQTVAQKYLETFQFGATEQFMEDIDDALKNGPSLNEQQLMMLKIAVLEALKDAGEIGPKAEQQDILKNKIGTLEALKQSGLAKGIQDGVPQQPVKESVSINYKDAPEDVKRQMEIQAGFQPGEVPSPIASGQQLDHAKVLAEMQKTQLQQQQSARQTQKNGVQSGSTSQTGGQS